MKNWVLYIIVLSFISIKAQGKIEIKLHFTNNKNLPKKIQYKKYFRTQNQAILSLNSLLQKIQAKGYIESSVDSTILQNNILNTYVYLGKKYTLTSLENGNLTEELTHKIHFKPKDYNKKVYSFNEIEELQQKILQFYENRGYPFTEVFLDSFSIKNQSVQSKIYVKPHQIFTIDTIIIEGKTNTKSRYLQNYLNIKKGDLYDKSKIDKISQKLAQLSFIKETRKAQLVFLNGKIKIYIFIEKQKSNEFDLLIGILPNDKLNDRKITITGNGRLHLFNSFGVGEEIYADFKQLKPKTQNLDIAFSYPFFLNLPIGLTGKFNLFKNDSSYLNLNTKVGVIYPFNGADFIQIYYQNKISNVLNYDTNQVRTTGKLPTVLDKTSNTFGLNLHFQHLDYIFNPRKGFNFTIGGDIGIRNIKKSTILTNIENKIYDNIPLSSLSFNIDFDFKYYIPILKRHSIFIANNTKIIVSKNVLQNEMYRIGGAKTLRGFDEEAIISPYFSLFSLEYHFSLSKNAYFYTFGDVALVEDARYGSNYYDIPFGFGIGTTFETKAGIFSLSYALGKQFDNKIEFKNGKIHFGYINLF